LTPPAILPIGGSLNEQLSLVSHAQDRDRIEQVIG
jgi:hypothetical protein